MNLPNLKKARELRGLTQDELSLKVCIGRSHISALEKGHAETTPKTAKKLAEALEYEIWQLASDDPKDLKGMPSERTATA